jgi:hypothetical protein
MRTASTAVCGRGTSRLVRSTPQWAHSSAPSWLWCPQDGQLVDMAWASCGVGRGEVIARMIAGGVGWGEVKIAESFGVTIDEAPGGQDELVVSGVGAGVVCFGGFDGRL